MSDVIDIIISAVDQASDVFNSIVDSATGMGDSISNTTTEASTGFDAVGQSAEGMGADLETAFEEANAEVERLKEELDFAEEFGFVNDVEELESQLAEAEAEAERLGQAIDTINGGNLNETSAEADDLEREFNETDEAIQNMNNDLGIINSSMLLQLGDQISNVAGGAEDMAQEMNENAISVGQLATQAGIAEPQMVSLINNISNATFPNNEAMMYVKSLDQIGVSSENLGQSATDLDKINDAFGMGANTVNSLGQELSVLGVDMNNVSSSFNALAYANANTVGGMDNYYNFLRKYDAQFKELGFNVDQASVIIAGATQKFGGGRAALSGLSTALKESNGDTRALEEALGLEAGSIENATKLTGEYEGQLQQLADEEAEHKTLLDQVGAAWEDLSLAASSAFSPVLSVIGLIGQAGSFGMQVKGLQELVNLTKKMTEIDIIDSAVKSGKAAIMSVVTVATTLYASIVGVLTGELGLVAAATAVWNAILAMNPIMLVVIALVALVAIIYEVGKAFGWWSNVQGMMSAIWDGINRIWQAFINHPDVQAVISAISNAWNTLVGAITGAWNAVMEFLGLNTSGDFDVVAAIINGIGQAWELITFPIRTVISLVQWVISVFNQFATGQMTLQGALLTIWNGITTALASIFSRIINAVLRFGAQMLARAIQAGRNFVNGIVNTLKSLPGRVFSIVSGVAGRIGSAIQHWVSTASSKVHSVIKAITSPFSGVVSSISGALNGVKNAITAPFRAAYHAVKPIIDNIKSGIDMITNLPFGGEAYGGELAVDANNGRSFNVNTGQYVVDVDNSPLVIEDNINLNLDLKNVPSNINTSQLIEALTNQDVLNALVDNRDFQDLDARVKQRLNLKNVRARGR